MTVVQSALGATLGFQSMALLGRSIQTIPKDPFNVKPMKQSKQMIHGFTDIMIGTGMLKPTANLISSL